MIEFMGAALLRPWWLLALPFIILAGIVLIKRVAMLSGWRRAIDPILLDMLEKLGRVTPGRGRNARLPLLIALIIAIALAGPARQISNADNFRNLDGVVIVMDLSRSIAEGGHLAEARTAARYLAERASARPVALVIYAGDAYLASTFTTDAEALGATIAVLDGATIPDAGSRPERGLSIANELLQNTGIISGDVILVTDGGGLSDAALTEVESIVSTGNRVSTLFVPFDEDKPSAGQMPKPDRSTLDMIAQIGGGVAGDALFPASVVNGIASGGTAHLASNELAVLIWEDYGRYLLLLALFPTLALFRRRG